MEKEMYNYLTRIFFVKNSTFCYIAIWTFIDAVIRKFNFNELLTYEQISDT